MFVKSCGLKLKEKILLIRFEFVDINGVVLNTGIAEVETQEDFVKNEEIFEEKFGYNENKYNAKTNEIYDKCIKTEVDELKTFNLINLLCRKMF